MVRKGKKKGWEVFHLCFIQQIPAEPGAGPDQSQDAETPCKSPTQVARA